METFNIPGMNFTTHIAGTTNPNRNVELTLCRMGLVKGRNLLIKAGFQLNPAHAHYKLLSDRTYKRGNLWVRYNSITKIWVLDNLE